MVLIPVLCPHCHTDQVIKGDKTEAGQQRSKCQNRDCPRYSFLLNPAYTGRLLEIKQQVMNTSLNGSGIRDTARVLQMSPTTVVNEWKKESTRTSANHPLLTTLNPGDVAGIIRNTTHWRNPHGGPAVHDPRPGRRPGRPAPASGPYPFSR